MSAPDFPAPTPGPATGAALVGDCVRLEVAPLPGHARTARLVASAVGRRAGIDEDFLDEVRLAVGEATARAIALNNDRQAGPAGAPAVPPPVVIELAWTRSTFTVTVHDQGDPATAGSGPDDGNGPDVLLALAGLPGVSGVDDLEGVAPGHPALGLGLVLGLVDDVEVQADDGSGTSVVMRWPLPPEL